MERVSQAAIVSADQPGSGSTTGNTLFPMTVVTLLFFMWGLLTSLNDVLIPHLKSIYTLNYVQAMLVQFCFFGAYFIVSLPAGSLIRRIGYQRGAVTGLVIAAIGCALFYPAANSGYGLFLFAFFVLAAGITILQVAANPYVAALGAPATASSRLTLTQAFNSFGTFIGPIVGSILILSVTAHHGDQLATLSRQAQAAAVQGPYLILAGALLTLAILFAVVRLPAIREAATGAVSGSLLQHKHLVLGVIGIFLYVGAEVSIGSFLVNFMGEPRIAGLSHADGAFYVGFVYWGGAMVGRFIGSAVMKFVSPGRVLACNAGVAILLVLAATFGHGHAAMWALLAVGLFNSIMFPTIFSMALHRLGPLTGKGSGVLCMGIVGGAIVPFIQGAVADSAGLQMSFLIPAACYVFILYFGAKYARLYTGSPAA